MEDTVALSLSTFVATRRQMRFAGAVAVLLTVVALALVPVAHRPLTVVPAFLPGFIAFIAATDLLTAFLIYRDALLVRSLPLALLGSGYCYTGLMVIPHVLTFPGVFSATGLFGAGPEAAVWFWVCWHGGFPLFVLAFALTAWRFRPWREGQARLVMTATLSGALLLVALVTAAIVLAGPALPPLVARPGFNGLIRSGIGPGIILLAAVVIGTLLKMPRKPTVVRVWQAVACYALLLDVLMTLLGGGRYSYGWYGARVISMISSSIVLIALLYETGRLLDTITSGERRLRRVVDGVGDALLAVDDRGRITDANPAAVALFGTPREGLRGLDAQTVVRACVLPLEVEVGENVLIARDVTERLRAEEASREAIAGAIEAADVKSRFLATMSHEIRTPINAVVGMSELILQTPLTDEAKDYAHVVRDSAEALLAVINDILDFSKIEAGATEIERAAFSPLVAVENAADILAMAARTKGLALATYIAPDVPRRAYGDAHRLRQILLNLISNAVKFTSNGYVTVRAVVERVQGERTAVVRFSVSDTGIGMPPEAQARLFTPFRQADAGTARRYGGTGLGLSIAKRLVELMGGEIGLESIAGQGTTFWFTLPLERIDASPEDGHGPALRGARVLVVDPEPTGRGVIEKYLLAWGAVAIATDNPAHAIALAAAAQARGSGYDLAIVADGYGHDGFATLVRLRDEAHLTAPAVFVSATDEPGQGLAAHARGFAAYLRKPLKQSMLHDALAGALDGRPAFAASGDDAAPLLVAHDLAILVADDNAVNRKLTLQQLKKLGYRGDAVEDGQEALDAVVRGRYDLVLMDCEMPVLDGYEATRAIRAAQAGSGARVTIVAMTANAMAGDREACLAAGMDDYLPKPVQLAELRGALERHAVALA